MSTAAPCQPAWWAGDQSRPRLNWIRDELDSEHRCFPAGTGASRALRGVAYVLAYVLANVHAQGKHGWDGLARQTKRCRGCQLEQPTPDESG